MPEVTVDHNLNLYYEIYGQGDPIVFIHGFAVDHLVFSGLTNYLQSGYQLVLLDNRGSGQSDCPDSPYTVETMAEDVAALCRTLNLERCHFIGHSLGGMILQRLAYRHPKLVRSAILCNTEMKIDIRYAMTAKARLVFLQEHCSPRALIENGMGWTFSSSFLERPGMIEDIISLRLANPFPITETGYQHQLHALLNFNSKDWVDQINVPCLVTGSDQDIIMRELNVKELAKKIANAKYHSFKGVGHAPFIEQPELFCKVLKAFFKQH
ncbi:MAG: alpha/beta fold hydrolase [Proteobacteria bacterium]|nr:alpha/beta fold hydrolase [Pseudomonadota bacterium]